MLTESAAQRHDRDRREQTLGATSVYGFAGAGLFGPGERHQLKLFAAQAAGALRHVLDAVLSEQMAEALRSRSAVDQALGIIIAG